jgi:hypothetical protein
MTWAALDLAEPDPVQQPRCGCGAVSVVISKANAIRSPRLTIV